MLFPALFAKQQSRSAVEIVNELQDRKEILEENSSSDEDSIDEELAALGVGQEAETEKSRLKSSAAIDANLKDLAKVPWIPTVVSADFRNRLLLHFCLTIYW